MLSISIPITHVIPLILTFSRKLRTMLKDYSKGDLRQLFRELDKDYSGSISSEEFKNFIENLGLDLCEQVLT
jgi:Ca2+-binding EF-hand superfamily protein